MYRQFTFLSIVLLWGIKHEYYVDYGGSVEQAKAKKIMNEKKEFLDLVVWQLVYRQL